MTFRNALDRAGIDFPGLCITVGCPGVGKTTWAHQNKTDDTLVVELDQFRIALFGGKQAYFDHPADKEVKSKTLLGSCFGAMRRWESRKFIISNTNGIPRTAAPFLRFAVLEHLSVHVVIFEAPFDIIMRRNNERPVEDHVPEERLREMFDDMQNPENQWWKGAGPVPFTVETITLQAENLAA